MHYLSEHDRNTLVRRTGRTRERFAREQQGIGTTPLPTLATADDLVGTSELGVFTLQENRPGALEASDKTREAYALCDIAKGDRVLLHRCVGANSGGFWVAAKCGGAAETPKVETNCLCDVLDALDTANGGPLATASVDALRVGCGCPVAGTVATVDCDGLDFPEQIRAEFSGFTDTTVQPPIENLPVLYEFSQLNGKTAVWNNLESNGAICRYTLANHVSFTVRTPATRPSPFDPSPVLDGVAEYRLIDQPIDFYRDAVLGVEDRGQWDFAVRFFQPGQLFSWAREIIPMITNFQNGQIIGPAQDHADVDTPVFFGANAVTLSLYNGVTGTITFS